MRRMGTTILAVAAGSALCVSSGAGSAAAQTVEHTIRSGDNLHLLAGYYYRDPRQWKKIWRENRKQLRSPGVLAPGKTLRVVTAPGLGWEIPYEDFRARVRGK